jgi:ketosteroid isomerase-like protein
VDVNEGDVWHESMTREEIANAEEVRIKAMLDGNAKALESLTGDELIYVHATGATETKDTYVELIGSGAIRIENVEREDLQVRIFGPVGIITGRAKLTIQADNGTRIVTLRFTSVWAKRDGAARFVSWHASPNPD